jgi:hypothetical protein
MLNTEAHNYIVVEKLRSKRYSRPYSNRKINVRPHTLCSHHNNICYVCTLGNSCEKNIFEHKYIASLIIGLDPTFVVA